MTMLTHWWLADMPVIPGPVRMVFYLGLLAICLLDTPSPLQSPRIIGKTEPALYTPVAVLRWLGIRWVRPEILSLIRALTIIAWLAAAVGLVQPVSGALTFFGFAFLHAVNAGALGSNHSTHSAVYALFCLSFLISPGSFSLDRYLALHANWPLLLQPGSILESGFATKLQLVVLVYIMFAAGVSKLRNGGRAWLRGDSLRYYVTVSADDARWPWLSRTFLARPWLFRYLALGSVAVELSAPLALLGPGIRLPLIAAWVGLHVGILCVMMPAYWVQMWCYLLLIDWIAVATLVTGQSYPAATISVDGPGATTLIVVGLVVTGALFVVLVRQYEEWPFTSVPMYSNGVAPDNDRLPTRLQLHPRAVRAQRGHHMSWKRPWVSTEIMEDVRLVPAGGAEPRMLFDVMAEQGARFVRWSQYAKVVRSVAIADIAAKPSDCPEADPANRDYPASRFLETLVPLVRAAVPDWQKYARLEFVCQTDTGWLPIAEAPLADALSPLTSLDITRQVAVTPRDLTRRLGRDPAPGL